MSGKARPSLRKKALDDVKHSNMSKAVKECIAEVFARYEIMVDSIPEEGIIADLKCIAEAEMLFHQREYKGEPIFGRLFAVIDLINRKNAEIERLNFENLQMIASIKGLEERARAEAIKEVLQKVEKLKYPNPMTMIGTLIYGEDFDKIAKEMGVEL